jgi:DivIVA domain-containing protein
VLHPADIEEQDFLVVVHGYHKGEVRAFLEKVAAVHTELLARLEDAPPPADDFESVGASVTNILKAAKESAAEMTAEAERLRAEVQTARADADRDADRLRAKAEAILADAHAGADRLRAEADAILADARGGAERIERDAIDRARAIGVEAEARVRNRLDEVQDREAAIRTRLDEVGEELRLARLTLDGGTLDLRDHVEAGVEAGAELGDPAFS